MKSIKCLTNAKSEITLAVIFAVLILSVSWMIKGNEYKDMWVIGMTGAYFVVSTRVLRCKKNA